MKEKVKAILHAFIDAFESDKIDLPPVPSNLIDGLQSVDQLMQTLSVELGSIVESDYFKCSRARFFHILRLALKILPRGSHLLDIGHAPGYLAEALHLSGYSVSGINLSEEWNSTYPDPSYLDRFNVLASDIEKNGLPYHDQVFDGIVFTEVLEHIAIKHPEDILPEFKRVLKPGGVILFSTPNVCNLSNILALASGENVFWPTSIFYGSTDRHNREWTPSEVKQLFLNAGFGIDFFYGMNDHANWRSGAAKEIYEFLRENPQGHALLRNTIIASFRSPG